MACAKKPEQRLVEGRATLQQSLTIDEDTIIWSASPESPGLTIDSAEPVVLDFGGAFIQSSAFGESPQNYRSLAILLRRAPSVTIRNATFCGFQTGLLAEAVAQIHLENVRFLDFHRGDARPSVAVHLQQPGQLNVESCHFQHLERALQLDATAEINIHRSAFYWLNRQVLQATDSSRGSFTQNKFFYIGLPEEYEDTAFQGGTYAFRQNNWAHVLRSGLPDEELTTNKNQAAYQPELSTAQWQNEPIDRLLREIGVSAPGLRLVDDWGWYDFSYPKAWLRESRPQKDIYLLTAPNGNWRLIGGEGYQKVVPKTGSFPTTLQAFHNAQSDQPYLEFEFLGKKFRKYGAHPAQETPVTFGTNASEDRPFDHS